MFVLQRLQRIVEVVNERGSIRVSELSELLHVTEETIRRDLDKLESEGKLTRSHGGAMRIQENLETPYVLRESTNAEQKKAIARAAVEHIHPHDRIILDPSSTAWHIAHMLPDMPLTVLTNSIKVALELSAKEKIQVISTGGMLRANSLSYVGFLAEQNMDHYHVDKVFFSCKGLHLDKGISEASESQARIKQKMLAIADCVYLLADFSKFGQQSFISMCTWDAIDVVITDQFTDRELLNQLAQRSIQVIQCKE